MNELFDTLTDPIPSQYPPRTAEDLFRFGRMYGHLQELFETGTPFRVVIYLEPNRPNTERTVTYAFPLDVQF